MRTSSYRRPMNRLIEKIVFWGLVMACRFATWPTSRSPSLVKATTEGVVRDPSALGMTTGSPPSMTDTTEFVVPRSIPMTLLMLSASRMGTANLRVVLHGRARAVPPEKLPLWQGEDGGPRITEDRLRATSLTAGPRAPTLRG